MTSYLRPASLAAAVDDLDADGTVQLLAGGTDLINEIRLRLVAPDVVVDTADLDELHVLDPDAVRLGAAVTMSRLLAVPWGGRLAALTDAADLLGGRQIQAVATLGGNVCHASPAAETATPLLAHDATVQVAGPSGERSLPIAELWTGPRRTALGRGELLVEVRVPAAAAAWASAYRRIELRKSVDIALVNASVALDVVDGVVRTARVAVGAAGPVPFRVPEAEAALTGVAAHTAEGAAAGEFAAAVEAAGVAAAAASRPIDDVRATADYRRAMVRVVVRRAAVAAAVRSQPAERP